MLFLGKEGNKYINISNHKRKQLSIAAVFDIIAM